MTDPLSPALATGITAATPIPAPASALDAGRAAGVALLDALRLDAPVGVPLREVAGGVAARFGAGFGGGADPVSAARLEGATLDFAREAKAFAIGREAAGPEAVRDALNAALDTGAMQADRLSAVASAPGDRITTIFEGATAHLRAI